MPIINRVGGGGAGGGLAFSVVRYEAAPTEADPAAENTIAVVTETQISGWVMQAEEPATANGLVWIEVATASEVAFYADKKQYLKVYPVSVQQYAAGTWNRCEAYVFQSGGWVNFSQTALYLYNNGNEYTNTTGGWLTEGKKIAGNSSATATAPTVTRNANNIVFAVSSSSASGVARCANRITIKPDVMTLTATGTFKSGGSKHLIMYVWEAVDSYAQEDVAASYEVPASTTETTLTCDVAALDGEYYIGFFLRGSTATLESMVLE